MIELKLPDEDARLLVSALFALKGIASPHERLTAWANALDDEWLIPAEEPGNEEAFDIYRFVRDEARHEWAIGAAQFGEGPLRNLVLTLGRALQERERERGRQGGEATLLDQLSDLFANSYYQQNRLSFGNLERIRQVLLLPEEQASLEGALDDEVRCGTCGVVLGGREVLCFDSTRGLLAPRRGRGEPEPKPRLGVLHCSRCRRPFYVRCQEKGCTAIHEFEGTPAWTCDRHRGDQVNQAAPPAPEVAPPNPPLNLADIIRAQNDLWQNQRAGAPARIQWDPGPAFLDREGEP